MAEQVQENFQLPKTWKDKLIKLSHKRGISRSQLIRDAIYEKYIEKDDEEGK